MSGIVNKVKEVLHKDHSSTTTHSTTGHSTTGHSTTGHSTNAGPHSTNVANAADPRIDSDRSQQHHAGATNGGYTGAGTGLHGTSGSTNAGPHSSNLANKADPRIDSDRDGSTNAGAHTAHTTGHSTFGNNSTNHGPHDSNIANKADPRFDSDRDGRAAHGTNGFGNSHSTGTTTGYGTAGTSGHAAGPHQSNIANKLDPRIDSDNDGSRNAGVATHQGGTTGYSGTHAGNSHGTNTGTHGGISHSTNAGPHDSNLANKADPRVDSDLDSKGNRHGASKGGILGASGSHATAGSGTAQNTAGPHNSDLLNKLDPRVDSDRDGSKTYGGNATHQ